jgi:hypothetical protein
VLLYYAYIRCFKEDGENMRHCFSPGFCLRTESLFLCPARKWMGAADREAAPEMEQPVSV